MVTAIKDKKKLEAFLTYLRGSNARDYVLAKVMLNTGLRISDVVDLRREHFFEGGKQKEYLEVLEKKTKKVRKIKINKALGDVIRPCQDGYLFASRKGDGYISTTQAYRILKGAADAVGIRDFGTHSLRKSWGYHSYIKSNHNIALLMKAFNHSSPAITLRYICIEQAEKDDLYDAVQF